MNFSVLAEWKRLNISLQACHRPSQSFCFHFVLMSLSFSSRVQLRHRWRKATQATKTREELGQGDKFVMTHTGGDAVLSVDSSYETKQSKNKKQYSVLHVITFRTVLHCVFIYFLSSCKSVWRSCKANVLETTSTQAKEKHMDVLFLYILLSVFDLCSCQNYTTTVTT